MTLNYSPMPLRASDPAALGQQLTSEHQKIASAISQANQQLTSYGVSLAGLPHILGLGIPTSAGTPVFNFYTSGNSNYDVRFVATGGNASAGGGTLVLDGGLEIVTQANSLQTGFQTAQSAHGTTGGTQLYNNVVNISTDDADCGSSLATSFSLGWYVQHVFGGANCRGGREAFFANLILNNGATAATSNPNRFYVAVSGQAQANNSDGGTLGGSEKGQLLGSNFIGALANGAVGFEYCAAALDQVYCLSGSSVKTKAINILSYGAGDTVQGATNDAALMITADTGATAGGKFGILFTDVRGANPMATTATLIGVKTATSATVANGIDLSGYTITGNFLKSAGYTVDGSGNVSANSVTTGAVFTSDPATLTGTSGSTTSMSQIINASGTFTLTLPSAAASNGRWLYLKSIASQAVNSASTNVVPLASATAGTAILAATAGKWAWLQSDGTNWIMMAGN